MGHRALVNPGSLLMQKYWKVQRRGGGGGGAYEGLKDLPMPLTRAPLGYFYNAPHWGGGGYFEPPSDLRNYWTDSKKFKRHLKALEKLSRVNKFY